MRDGEVWMVERRQDGKWKSMSSYDIKKYAESTKRAMNGLRNFKYRVVKYVRQEAK